MDPVADQVLLHIAEWALVAPVPEGWIVHLNDEGDEYFHNYETKQSMFEHPMDEHYRAVRMSVLCMQRKTLVGVEHNHSCRTPQTLF